MTVYLNLRIVAEWILHLIESFSQFGILFYQHFATFQERFVLLLKEFTFATEVEHFDDD